MVRPTRGSKVQKEGTGTHYLRLAGKPNNLVPRGTKLSAIDVTQKANCERLVLILGPRRFAPLILGPRRCAMIIHTPTTHNTSISQFLCLFTQLFPRSGPHILRQQVLLPSPSTLFRSIPKIVEFWCPTWWLCFQFRLWIFSPDGRGLPFYYPRIGFLEYLPISGKIQ